MTDIICPCCWQKQGGMDFILAYEVELDDIKCLQYVCRFCEETLLYAEIEGDDAK